MGNGYDAHRFVGGRDLVICGVRVDHAQGLAGHSDADVGAHALMDALIGAAGLGDIGELFPDTDPTYEDASSMWLLMRTVTQLANAGWQVENVDVTVVCEAPRLSGYRPKMRERLAKTLGIAGDAVNVKATTTEGMGFEGHGEGIAAHAVCLLSSR